ncbi:pilus assembly protein PilB [Marinobacter sp. SS21]|uniref:pilus assembly protein PilB n=1 Tax=Marinobacter sp. SS21 TaxID=2979460 RepID=UPI00232C2685|nr:pilus assembly protein PilB [Marinobacter sp. SS21]MDC0663348.1 pilus assembly protein PilB [Marinobacter sp. SS21]
MKISHGLAEKSRLGRLLVNRGYLTEVQLEQGLRLQLETGQRLGEVFVQSGWITEKELGRVLKHQARYRNAAALVTMITLPFQPLVSFAANSPENRSANLGAAELIAGSRWQPMTDEELARAVGRANEQFLERVDRVRSMAIAAQESEGEPLSQEQADAMEGLKLVTETFLPVLNFLDAEMTITGVHYREGEAPYEIHEGGALRLALPERIERVSMQNIRIAGGPGAILGHVTLSDIRFEAGSHITISAR